MTSRGEPTAQGFRGPVVNESSAVSATCNTLVTVDMIRSSTPVSCSLVSSPNRRLRRASSIRAMALALHNAASRSARKVIGSFASEFTVSYRLQSVGELVCPPRKPTHIEHRTLAVLSPIVFELLKQCGLNAKRECISSRVVPGEEHRLQDYFPA